MNNKYNIRIRELQDIGLNEYLSLEINKCFYDFCYEYLKVERDLPGLDVFDMLKNSYSNALIFTDNYTTAPYELNDYFVNKFNKLEGLESEQLFIKTIEYHFFRYLIMCFNENIIVDEKCNYCIGDNQVLAAISGKVFKFHWIVIGLTHEVLEKKYRPQDKRKSRYKGWFANEVVDSMFGYVEDALPPFQVKPIMRFKESVKAKIFPKEKEVIAIKKTPNLLIEGKKLNIVERYHVANKILDIYKKINSKNIPAKEKHKLLALIMGCSEQTGRELFNGTQAKRTRINENIVNPYLAGLI